MRSRRRSLVDDLVTGGVRAEDVGFEAAYGVVEVVHGVVEPVVGGAVAGRRLVRLVSGTVVGFHVAVLGGLVGHGVSYLVGRGVRGVRRRMRPMRCPSVLVTGS